MAPDMMRLCEAAIKAGDGEGLAFDTYDGLSEAIVRAVLMALRDVDTETLYAAALRSGWPSTMQDEHRAIIDHILAEPATARGC